MEPKISTSNQPLTAEEISTIKIFYDVWKLKAPELLDEVCWSDWEETPSNPGLAEGLQGLKELIKGFIIAAPDVEINLHEILGTHEYAAVRGEIAFTHSQKILGIPPTGKRVVVPIHEFHHIKDGKLTRLWHMEDWFHLLVESGAWDVNQ